MGESHKLIRKFVGLFTILCFMGWLMPSYSFAAEGEDLFPGKPVRSPSYAEYPREAYILDYVPPEDPSIFDKAHYVILDVFHSIMNLGWSIYLFVVEWVIRLMNLSFDDALFSKLFAFLEAMMPQFVQSIWTPLWFLVASVGILAVIFMWAKGSTSQSLISLFGMILLLAVAPAAITSLPSYLTKANELVTSLSGEIMGRLIESKGRSYLAGKKKELEQKDVQIRKEHQQLYSRKDLSEIEIRKQEKKLDQANKQLINEIDIPSGQAFTTVLSLHVLDDTIWETLVKKPYYIANFGSVELGKTYFDRLMRLGTKKEERIKKLREWGGIDVDSGVAQTPSFSIFTSDGFGERGYKLIAANFLGLIPLYLIVAIALSILLWKARAVGRAVFFLFDGLMALYPGYGVRYAVERFLQVFAAFLMVLYYSVSLAIFLALWLRIQDNRAFGLSHFADQIFLILILIIGLWSAAKGISQRIESGPHGRGIEGSSRGSFLPKLWMGGQLLRRAVQNPLTRMATKGVTKSLIESAKLAGEGLSKAGESATQYLDKVDQFQEMKEQVKRRLPDRMKKWQPKQMDLTANLSDESRQVFRDMMNKKMNPTKKGDLLKYLKQYPHQSSHVKELVQWLNKEPYEQVKETPKYDGDHIPIRPPKKNTPEYLVWMKKREWRQQYKLWLQAKKQVRNQRWKEYRQKKLRYDQSWFRRWTQKRPEWNEPTRREVLKEYRKLKDQMKE